MKKLKFKVYDKATQKMWVLGTNTHDSLEFDKKNNVIYKNYQTGETSQTDYVLIPYTGFEDENGNNIYIGDIVKYGEHLYQVVEELATPSLIRLDNYYIDYDDFEHTIYSCGDVEPSFQGFNADNIVSLYEIAINMSDVCGCLDCQIVGNIYENKELLEDE